MSIVNKLTKNVMIFSFLFMSLLTLAPMNSIDQLPGLSGLLGQGMDEYRRNERHKDHPGRHEGWHKDHPGRHEGWYKDHSGRHKKHHHKKHHHRGHHYGEHHYGEHHHKGHKKLHKEHHRGHGNQGRKGHYH